jgi:hypothetical protein
MVLPGSPGGRVGRCRDLFKKAFLSRNEEGLLYVLLGRRSP